MYFLFEALFWEISNSRRYAIQNFGPQIFLVVARAVTARNVQKKWKYCHRKQPVENRYHYSKKATYRVLA